MNTETNNASGTLWVVATPIGNLEDMTPRAQRILAQVAVIAAEDTRISARLPGVDGTARMASLHEHSDEARIERLIDDLRAGVDVALISDAGTPLISDPGFQLVSAAHDAGIAVRTVPGPSAAIAALSVAGLPTDRFLFEGFLPARSGARQRRLQALAAEPATLIFYVPARDLNVVLADMKEVFGSARQATLARELTKLHETVRRDSLAALREWVAADKNQQRGEAVLVVAGSADDSSKSSVEAANLARSLAQELPPSRAAKVLAKLAGMTRKQAWEMIESFKEG